MLQFVDDDYLNAIGKSLQCLCFWIIFLFLIEHFDLFLFMPHLLYLLNLN